MNVTVRSRMRLIMDFIGPELSELFPLKFAKIAESDFVRSWMRLIMDLIRPELSELFPLEFAKIAESDFVYTIKLQNVDRLVPNMVTVYMTMSLIMGQT